MKYLLLLLLLPFFAIGQNIDLSKTDDATPLNGIAYWYEPQNKLDVPLSQIWNNTNAYPFIQGSRYKEFFNAENKPVYAHFKVIGKPGDIASLVIDNANIDSLQVCYSYLGKLQQLQTGSYLPPVQGVPNSTKFVFLLKLDGTEQKVLLKGQTSRRLILPLVLVKPPFGYASFHDKMVKELLMLGMVLMLSLYQMLRLVYSRNAYRFWYTLYLLALIFYAFLYIRGYGHFLGLPAQKFITRFGVVSGACAYLFAMLFAWYYLDKSKAPNWYLKLYKVAFAIPFATILVDFMGNAMYSNYLLMGMGLTGPFLMLAFAFFVFRKGDISTIYFIAGWTSVSLSVMINSMLLFKIIDPSFKQIPQILLAFTCLEMLLLSVGMGYRASLVTKEKVALQAQLLNLLQTQKESLELQVSERTRDLEQALIRVEESDALKARLLAIISHDLRMPFVSLNAALDLLSLNILTPEKAQQKLAKIKGNIRHIAGTLENLLTWSKHQQQHIETVPQPVFLKQMVRNVVALLETNINSRNLELVLEIEDELVITADPFQVETVLRNLLSNAIKASEDYTTLGVRCQPDAGAYRITIFDSGSGLQEPDLNAWLKNRSTLKDGSTLQSGLGLQICREFLANHNAVLQYQHNGQGSEFSFVLPSATAQTQLQAAECGINS